jgi:hypothetical protein
MILTIELTPDQEARLQAEADAKGSDPESVLQRLVETLPAARVDRRRKTTAEIAAGWKASGLPSVYGRDPRDATVIARTPRRSGAAPPRGHWASGMILDTDVLVLLEKENPAALLGFTSLTEPPYAADFAALELLNGSENSADRRRIETFLADFSLMAW